MRTRLLPGRRGAVVAGAAIAVAVVGRAAARRGIARPGIPLGDAVARRAAMQKAVSKLIYGFASRTGADPGMACLNYGYAPLEPAARDAAPTDADDPDSYGKALYERVAGAAPLAGRDVLEVGCGRGGGAAAVFERYGPRSLVGLDLAASAIERARRDHGRPGLEFVQGDAEALPFGDAAFDVVLNVESAHWYPNVEKFLTEAFRVLRPGGALLLADLRHTSLPDDGGEVFMPRVDMRTFVAQLEASPFELVEQEDITSNVRRALELDSPRRRRMIERAYPRLLHRRALAFSGVVGTPPYEGLAGGELTYQRFVLRKAA